MRLIAFVGSSDLDRSCVFFRDTLGLRLIDESAFACAFDVDGMSLRVTAVPEVKPAGYTVLGFGVDDIAARIRELVTAGIEFNLYDGMNQDDLGVWTAPSGAKVAWFHDPDGNVLSLTEFAQTGH